MERNNIIQEALLRIHENNLAITEIQKAIQTLQQSNSTIQNVLLNLRDD